ncbi:MAG TPA: hypothetical protein PLZ32_07970 [Saprospiraceae bacterium]|nr:hypothetical protein [Saprospiraceae bacterium]
MSKQDILIAHPQTREQFSALKAFMQELKIKFEVSKNDIYDPEFVKKILESKEQAKKGEVTSVKREDLKEFLGLL